MIYRIGTASWTDPTLLATDFYPADCKSAELRLRYYAERFDTVEVDATYYALPSERNSALWAERTPEGFRFNVKAFAWLTLHEAETRALPRDLRADLDSEAQRQRRIPAPGEEARREAFSMFHSALEPLRAADKLACLLFQFPPWFTATSENRDYILRCREWSGGDRLAIEFRHASWLGERAEETLAFLAANELTFVCTDAPRAPSIPAPLWRSTSDVAYVRFHGRNRDAWFRRRASAAERFKYFYSDAELERAAQDIGRIDKSRTVYVLFNNCYADYGVRNALTMRGLLGG